MIVSVVIRLQEASKDFDNEVTPFLLIQILVDYLVQKQYHFLLDLVILIHYYVFEYLLP